MSRAPGFNPYLPFWETVPDGEPHVFDGRIYIYGSHDSLAGSTFCSEDYVCWSAPVEDPGAWTFQGYSYHAMQDPFNGKAKTERDLSSLSDMPLGSKEHPHLLYAPDCCKGPDGRYYLYYAMDFVGVISVAVSDSPAGPFKFLDYVTRPDGTLPEKGIYFDPAVLSEEGGNYLYYGFAPAVRFPGQESRDIPGGLAVRLADDMHTMISDPVLTANGCDTAKGTSFEEHPFFEASSIRHFGDWYYFVYSSLQGHELCYAMGKSPLGPFEYKGVIVSNADLGYKGATLPTNYWGNNHGGLVQFNGQTYIFWHRQSHGNEYSRQGCADRVEILPDGTIPQIEITSCGLNGEPLSAKGKYQTYIACSVMAADRTKMGHVMAAGPGQPVPDNPPEMPYITEEKYRYGEKGLRPYIANIGKGASAGFKYFAFTGKESRISALLRGNGSLKVSLDGPEGEVIAELTVSSDDWITAESLLPAQAGTHALYFTGTEGTTDFSEFEII